MERVWGGRRLADRFGMALPDGKTIGEAWMLVDRPEAQSVVSSGPLAGTTLGALWRSDRRETIFGSDALDAGDRFPLLIKLLDCEQTLSVQVHPPAEAAAQLGGEPKTEMWVILDADDGAHIFAGLRNGVTRESFEAALNAGEDVSTLLSRRDVSVGDVMFLPSGRVHAIGAGNVILEVQQNSDTTYRVFDFNRPGLDGKPRELHIDESLRSIDWDDHEPPLVTPDGDTLVHNGEFDVGCLSVDRPRTIARAGRCAAVMATDGPVSCGGQRFAAGELFFLPADADVREVAAAGEGVVTVLCALLPNSGH